MEDQEVERGQAAQDKLKKSKNPTTRKRATFAHNVRTGKIGGKKKK